MKVIFAGFRHSPKRDIMAVLYMVIALITGVLAGQLISRMEPTTFPNQVALDLSSAERNIVESRGVVMCAFNKKTSRLAWTQVSNSR